MCSGPWIWGCSLETVGSAVVFFFKYFLVNSMARKVVIEEDEEDSDGGGAVNESQPQTQSRELFGNFMREEFQLHGLDIPANVPL